MRALVQGLEASQIRQVANAAMGRSDVLAFWFGESDEVTPAQIRAAAVQSIEAGETFYSHNLGLPSLREALAAYTAEAHGACETQRIAVTSGGVNALMLAVQALVDPGDEVVVVTPVWPNLVAQPRILGAKVRCVSLTPRAGAWQLDVQQLLDAITPNTRLLVLNAPNNPTGWCLHPQEQQQILQHCRNTGTWILSDEVYERLFYAEGQADAVAPSFLDVADSEDRVVVAQSFSKAFLMTGWRLGWLNGPAPWIEQLAKLIEFNTSCAPVFTQRAAEAALVHSARITPQVVAQIRAGRDRLLPQLQVLPGVEVAVPEGGMYAFFRLDGHPDSLLTAQRLVAEVGLGLAPGSAFAPEAEGWLRWCFATRSLERLDAGVLRLRRWLAL